MPTYRYECSCGRSQEVIHSIHLDPEVLCEACNSMMQRKVQGAYVTFKGTGFYSTDKNK